MARKTYNEKLRSSSDLPKIEDISGQPEAVKRYGGTKMLIAAPLQYNEIMAGIPAGSVTTTDRVRSRLAALAQIQTFKWFVDQEYRLRGQ